MNPGQAKYRKVSISTDLMEKVDKIVDDGQLGYRNNSEFVHEAVRLRLQDLHQREP